jgi:hypothetical protein
LLFVYFFGVKISEIDLFETDSLYSVVANLFSNTIKKALIFGYNPWLKLFLLDFIGFRYWENLDRAV